MSATYSSSLPSERDFVRRLIGDVDVSTPTSAFLQDEEIDAIIYEAGPLTPARKYFAAADALSSLLVQWSSLKSSQAFISKSVSKLSISFGSDSTGIGAIQARIKELRAKGTVLLAPKPYVFRVLGQRRVNVVGGRDRE